MGFNVTKHARERWLQRVNPDAGTEADQQILKALVDAEYLGELDEDGIGYYVNTNYVIFCCDLKKSTIITVYGSDYGFSEEINRSIADKLVQNIRKAKQILEKERAKTEDSLAQLAITKVRFQQEIELKEIELSRIEAAEKEVEASCKVKEREYRLLVRQLACSVSWKADVCVLKNGGLKA